VSQSKLENKRFWGFGRHSTERFAVKTASEEGSLATRTLLTPIDKTKDNLRSATTVPQARFHEQRKSVVDSPVSC